MGINESKSLTYMEGIEKIRSSIINDSLNKDFFICLNNLPENPITINNDISRYNIINNDNIVLLSLINKWIKKKYEKIDIYWGDMNSGSIPINNIDKLENEIDSIYFISDVKNINLEKPVFFYVIGKLKNGIYFTIYIDFGKINEKNNNISRFIFYNDLKNIQKENIYNTINSTYTDQFLDHINSL